VKPILGLDLEKRKSTRKVNTAIALVLFLLGSFGVIIAAIRTPAVQYYTGGIVIALFVGGLFLAWGLTIVQTKKIAAADAGNNPPPAAERQQQQQQDEERGAPPQKQEQAETAPPASQA
jgi:hypothetical protein